MWNSMEGLLLKFLWIYRVNVKQFCISDSLHPGMKFKFLVFLDCSGIELSSGNIWVHACVRVCVHMCIFVGIYRLCVCVCSYADTYSVHISIDTDTQFSFSFFISLFLYLFIFLQDIEKYWYMKVKKNRPFMIIVNLSFNESKEKNLKNLYL